MTEGPTARLRAMQIWERFGNDMVEEIETRSRKVYVEIPLLIGKKLDKATSYGKNILLYFGEYLIRIHLMMYGSIRYENSKPHKQLRLRIKFNRGELFVYNAPIIEIGEKEELMKRLIREYGIDPLFNWNRKKLKELVMEQKGRKIGDVLLDQHIFAGIGNILRNEILFRAKINPERQIEELEEKEVESIIEYARKLSHKFLKAKMEYGIKNILMIYNKKFCPICRNKIILYRQEPNKRKTFYCPVCQK